MTFPVTRESPLSTCVREGEAYGASKAAGGEKWDLIKIYVDGAGAAYLFASVSDERGPFYCPPQSLAITTQNLINILDDHIARANPPLPDDSPIAMILLLGLEYTFPCKHQ
jgi:hypothetical protein